MSLRRALAVVCLGILSGLTAPRPLAADPAPTASREVFDTVVDLIRSGDADMRPVAMEKVRKGLKGEEFTRELAEKVLPGLKTPEDQTALLAALADSTRDLVASTSTFFAGRYAAAPPDDDPRFGTLIYPGASENCTNRRDDDCDGQRDYNDGSCTPMNDTCGPTAVALPGAGTYSGSTRGLRSDYTLSCTGGSSDAVFTFTLTEPRDVRATAASPSGERDRRRPVVPPPRRPRTRRRATMSRIGVSFTFRFYIRFTSRCAALQVG